MFSTQTNDAFFCCCCWLLWSRSFRDWLIWPMCVCVYVWLFHWEKKRSNQTVMIFFFYFIQRRYIDHGRFMCVCVFVCVWCQDLVWIHHNNVCVVVAINMRNPPKWYQFFFFGFFSIYKWMVVVVVVVVLIVWITFIWIIIIIRPLLFYPIAWLLKLLTILVFLACPFLTDKS